jgi:hypothetical protein
MSTLANSDHFSPFLTGRAFPKFKGQRYSGLSSVEIGKLHKISYRKGVSKNLWRKMGLVEGSEDLYNGLF